ncbi:hypothetical protein Bca4012_051351 [Brassica carinata]|uniref:Uncharacterized protein n=1 Tax=Brassica carinata TaxID=52824 RepID=A0A8X7R900_BRACI|nr:hypothetical protein Bca52824_053950 [Brassica carinata]
MWDSMIENVKFEIYKKEKRPTFEVSLFYKVINEIIMAHWAKNNTPLQYLAHSLNPSEDSTKLGPHKNPEVSSERMKCFRRLFLNIDDCLCG